MMMMMTVSRHFSWQFAPVLFSLLFKRSMKNVIFNIIALCTDINNMSVLILVAIISLHDVKTSTVAGSPAYV
jgi:hypothetical protein